MLASCALLPLGCALLPVGCASPGPPRPPSLQVPQPVRDLTASRQGDTVELRFTMPQRTTDGAGLRPPEVVATLCRSLGGQPCNTVSGFDARPLSVAPAPDGKARVVVWHDVLPTALASGSPQPLAYRIRLANLSGHAAEPSAVAWTAAGAAPTAIENLQAQGTRDGILLAWTPAGSAAGEVLLHRELAAPVPAVERKNAPHDLWLQANGSPDALRTLDSSAQHNIPYRYTAVRRLLVQLGGRTVEIRSQPSAPVTFTLRSIYPPAAPTGLTAAAFTASGHFAIDLIWQPVPDPDLAGYNIVRESCDITCTTTQLNSTPVVVPGFHDATAVRTTRDTYSVTAVDREGNQSAAATVIVYPSAQR